MPKMNFLASTYLPKIFLCCLGFCLCLVSSTDNVTRGNAPVTQPPSAGRNSRESYEEYDANDRDLLFDNFKTYEADETIEKGIRKLDTSVESAEKPVDDDKAAAERATGAVSSPSALAKAAKAAEGDAATTASSIDRKDEDEDGVVFEDSEAGDDAKSNISGTLVTKLIPEILKYNGRMVMPVSQDQAETVRPQEPKSNAIDESKSVVQKLSPRRVRQQSNVPPAISSSIYAPNVSRLEDIFDLYNPYRLFDVWEENRELEKLSPLCRTQTEVFLLALQRGASWAIKSE